MTLQCNDLSLSIADKNICKALNIDFKPGEFWGIMGVNGVGKTSLLKVLIGLNHDDKHIHTSGTVTLDKKNIQHIKRFELAQSMGMMLQEYEYNFPSTVLEAALIGRHPYIKQWQWLNQSDQRIALDALDLVELKHLSHRQVSTLSGGEKRRLNLATLLTQNPEYYLLDEPVNHLDIKAQLNILSLLQDKFSLGQQCGIMVIHEPNLAYRFCDHILLLFNDGHYLSGETDAVLTQDNLSQLYDCPIHQIDDAQHRLFIPLAKP
ncbi:ABC transporter ATP-binding protein [sulfur-oxidizing endosymbiont of Gigantopelta aegis]|uniref:ABC transporter ATP-binding protein n=1 Tax=sulfur-oxidizing endosymbiont of Gigantopelta aegis TaxID=2794934 RepID=UPI0018DB6450|nr:ABC transporter ATP-binding protein [sulfur-oxidizing endosymbiont of Gigantopelta aegis]